MADLRYALRMMRANLGFSAVAVLSLALGIGANTAIFSLIDAVLLRWLPVKNPQELFVLAETTPRGPNTGANYPDYIAYRDRSTSFNGVAAYSSADTAGMRIKGVDNAATEVTALNIVSGNYFEVLGVRPAIGRLITPEDDKVLNASPYAAISYDFWKRRFALDPHVVGRDITLNGSPFMIVGVTQYGFTGIETGSSSDLYIPIMMRDSIYPGMRNWNNRNNWWLTCIGRLKRGVPTQKAGAELTTISAQQAADDLRRRGNAKFVNRGQKMTLVPGSQGYSGLRNRLTEPLIVLMIVVGVVLLIACANVANLLLARAAARQKEIAIRLAIGASRRRLISQLLTESVVLSAMGGVAGIAFAWLGVKFLMTLMPRGSFPVALAIHADLRLLSFTLGLSLLTGVFFGLIPAFQATRPSLVPSLKDDGSATPAGRESRINVRKVLVVAQVSLSLLLLIGAGLFTRSLANLRSMDSGFTREHLLTVRIDPQRYGYDGTRLRTFYGRLLERTSRLPGVQVASLGNVTPLGGRRWNEMVSVQDRPWDASERRRAIDMNAVSPRYFETIGIHILKGRDFRDQDSPVFTPDPPKNGRRPGDKDPADLQGPHFAIINESMERRFFPHENPIGKRFSLSDNFEMEGSYEIIGVVSDVRYFNLRSEPERMIYVPNWRLSVNFRTLCLRTINDPGATVNAIRREVMAIDSAVPVLGSRTMDELIDNNLLQERMVAELSSIFGSLALTLAAVGLYGIMAHAVTRRTREIGIRMALGAPRAAVLWLILRDASVLVIAGAALGIPVAAAVTKYASSLLYGIGARDPLSIVLATLTLIAVAVTASYIPARRASKVDPMVALRYE